VDVTVACAGATKPSAVAHLKTMGFKTIVNLWVASEEGADLEAGRRRKGRERGRGEPCEARSDNGRSVNHSS